MVSTILDRLPSGSLDDFHKFRDGHFDFLYLCRTCHRSFDSTEARNNCKFCGSDVVELRKTNKEHTVYKYWCPTCERNFTTKEKLTVCNECRTDYLHVYTWDMLNRKEKLYIKMRKSLMNVFSNNNRQIAKTRLSSIQTGFAVRSKEEMPTY